MVRKLIHAGLFAGFGALALLASYGVAISADDKIPDISTIMTKSFGKGGLKSSITTAVKGEKWDDAVKLAKEWNDLGQAIGKNKAPKGDAKSWEKLCSGFGDATKGVLAGTEKKNAEAVTKAIGTINCGACHKAHKGA